MINKAVTSLNMRTCPGGELAAPLVGSALHGCMGRSARRPRGDVLQQHGQPTNIIF